MDEKQPSENESRSCGKFNRAAIRRFALKVSQKTRLGKYTRVSEDFINEVEAEIESAFRAMRNMTVTSPMGDVDPEQETFLTGRGLDELAEAFRIKSARIIHAAVNKRRTGKTL